MVPGRPRHVNSPGKKIDMAKRCVRMIGKDVRERKMAHWLTSGLIYALYPGATDTENKSEPEAPRLEEATFAGGCFWCMEPLFDQLDGVVSVTVGYTGGRTKEPSYEEVCSGTTGHAEAVKIVYDPVKVAYSRLLDIFWKNIDPTVQNRQFCDVGTQYRTAVFYHSEAQKKTAEGSRDKLMKSRKIHIYTEIVPAGDFYPAEAYHQTFYRKNPNRYVSYHHGCGRDERLQELWGREDKVS